MARKVIERIVEANSGTSLEKGVKEMLLWFDSSNYSRLYRLEELMSEGWEVIDVKVSTSVVMSEYEYGSKYKYDHTIMVLELREAYEDGFVGDYGVNC